MRGRVKSEKNLKLRRRDEKFINRADLISSIDEISLKNLRQIHEN